MRKNVIILTSGLSGSSVLTGLIARAGYWTGVETHKKWDYETHENRDLIELNRRLFKEAGYTGNYQLDFSPEASERITALRSKIDCTPYQSFIARCNQCQPWIWKDPRLWLTIGFWSGLLDLESCSFIVLTRGIMQSWISRLLRRQIVTYRYSRTYEQSIQAFVGDFLSRARVPSLAVTYEELIVRPAVTINALNSRLGTNLSVEDLQTVYRRPLYRSPRNSPWKHVKAMLIYVKNYSERVDLVNVS